MKRAFLSDPGRKGLMQRWRDVMKAALRSERQHHHCESLGQKAMTGHQNCEGVAGQMSRDDMSTGSLKLGVAVAAVIGFLVSSSVVAAAQDVSFRAAVNYAVGSNPYSVAVADFNRDGIDDLAVVNHCNDSAPQCRGA